MKEIAIISGASSGMGKEFVKLIDAKKLDELWIIARRKEKLEELSKQLSTKTKILDFDLTVPENLKNIQDLIKKEAPKIQYLINCSGFGKFGDFDEVSLEDNINMIDLNIKALVWMTSIAVPYMKPQSHIIQLCSTSAFQSVPYLNVYASTKAFILSYSRALSYELKNKKISVTCVCPNWTKTDFFARASKTNSSKITHFNTMYDPRKVVEKALKDADKCKQLSIFGYKARAQVRLAKLLPQSLITRIWIKQQGLKF